MRNWICIVLVMFTCFSRRKLMGQPTSEPSGESGPTAQALACNQFASDLYGRLPADGANRIFSPLSVRTALLLAEAGARGKTADEMAAVLHVPADGIADAVSPISDSHLSVANAMWVAKRFTLVPDYVRVAQQSFQSLVQVVDFNDAPAASQIINDWVSGKTAGKIENLISAQDLSGAVRLVLTNAVYFKADWLSPFEASATHADDFQVPGGVVSVQMMRQISGYAITSGDGFSAIELPYRDSTLSMVLMLPNAVDGLGALEAEYNSNLINKVVSQLKPTLVDLSLPKFKIAQQVELNGALAALGMHNAFDPHSADFSGIDAAANLFISKVIHKAYISVDEKGTEAAAATGITMRMTAVFRQSASFRVDHPFLWLIRDRSTGAIIFLGRVTDPTQK